MLFTPCCRPTLTTSALGSPAASPDETVAGRDSVTGVPGARGPILVFGARLRCEVGSAASNFVRPARCGPSVTDRGPPHPPRPLERGHGSGARHESHHRPAPASHRDRSCRKREAPTTFRAVGPIRPRHLRPINDLSWCCLSRRGKKHEVRIRDVHGSSTGVRLRCSRSPETVRAPRLSIRH